jgi:hypothetical protein
MSVTLHRASSPTGLMRTILTIVAIASAPAPSYAGQPGSRLISDAQAESAIASAAQQVMRATYPRAKLSWERKAIRARLSVRLGRENAG